MAGRTAQLETATEPLFLYVLSSDEEHIPIKTSMEPWSALKMMCHKGARTHTHTRTIPIIPVFVHFVHVTISFIHIVSVNYYFTVECFLIMIKP